MHIHTVLRRVARGEQAVSAAGGGAGIINGAEGMYIKHDDVGRTYGTSHHMTAFSDMLLFFAPDAQE